MATEVVSTLRSFIQPYQKELHWKNDGPNGFYAETTKADQKGKPEFFASAQVRKNAVSFYLMPVYCFPDLLEGISPGLMARMQGKSCFNFKAVDEDLFRELQMLVDRSYQRYKQEDKI